ncbi:3'-5' exonuclease domain-containing protein [Aphelenchoides besseyi]|nr:3'-5' exonuclease domain-containing protein [Aphelenchoides besseyi]KAI6194733.1 3'-5' exonuclease domain-containing protein [Aphelenchoides besseyi]
MPLNISIDLSELVDGQNLSKYESQLDQLYEQSDNKKRLYATFIDILLSTSTKSTELEPPDTTIRRLTILRRFMAYINDMESSRLQKAQSKLEYESESRVNAVFKLALATRWYDKFAHLFQNETITAKFSVFLDSQIDNDLDHVLPWAFYSNCISQCNVEKIIARAVIDSRNNEKAHIGTILNLMTTHSFPDAILKMVRYLDDSVALYKSQYQKVPPRGPQKELKLAREMVKAVSESQMLKYINNLRIRAELNESLVPNAVFVRKMRHLIHVYPKSQEAANEDTDIVQQNVLHLMNGDDQMQYAVLKFIAVKDRSQAMFYVAYLNVPQENWPLELKGQCEENWKDAQKQATKEQVMAPHLLMKVSFRCSKLEKEYTTYKMPNSLSLLNDGAHVVTLIDQPYELESLFYPFLEKNTKFGFDAEWEQSYSGEVGTLGLLQISTLKQTMLLDVAAFAITHQFTQTQWSTLFSKLLAMDNNDLKTILHNFPFLLQTDYPKNGNMICLRNVFEKLSHDKNEIYEQLFEEEPPSSINLAEISDKYMQIRVPKSEQSSVWTFRPLRKKQLKYAALDSYLCITIYAKLNKQLTREIGQEETNRLLSPMQWPIKNANSDCDSGSNSSSNGTDRAGRKTKAQHFTNDELTTIIQNSNNKLQVAGANNLQSASTRRYIADSMCSQLGILLRRCGLSVLSGNDPIVISNHCNADSEMRILTCGKAVNKFPFFGRVLNIAASSTTLDVQLNQFLQMERLVVDLNEMNNRCTRCNSKWLVWTPTAVMRYLHTRFCLLNTNGSDMSSYTPEDLFAAKDQLKNIDREPFIGYNSGACEGTLGQLNIMRLQHHVSIPGVKRLPLTLATHINYVTTEFPPNLLHAICASCGRENAESTILANSKEVITWE